jgi:RNA polymerase sigma-70 factor (ECF subfamily)
MPPPALDPSLLLEHVNWLRALALALVHDPDRAEDLTQETYLRALESPPPQQRSLRAWLATVLRNLWRQEHRLEGRRRAREASVARPAEGEPGTDVVERAELHRRLVECVTELEEPFRTTLLLRYFDGLLPKAVAERLGVPEATVRSRLRRGLERLRLRLDQDHDNDRSAWMASMAMLGAGLRESTPAAAGLGLGSAGAGTALGILLMDAKFKFAIGLGLVTSGALLLPRVIEMVEVRPEAAAPVPSARPFDPISTRAESVGLRGTTPGEERAAIVAENAPDESRPVEPTPPMPEAGPVRGRVLDVHSQPVAAHELLFHASDGAPLPLHSDAVGDFEIEGGRTGRVVSSTPGYATILEASIRRDPRIAPVLVVSPGVSLSGRVVDAAGEPVAGARVEATLPRDLFRDFRVVLDASLEPERFATSDARGAFALSKIPSCEEARLVVRRDGYVEFSSPVPQLDRKDMRIVLEAEHVATAGLRGFVLGPDGAPIEGARVSAGLPMLRTAADGSFQFDAEVRAQAIELVAVAPGFLPARETATMGSDGPLWPEEILLRVSGNPFTMLGQVVDESGAPAAGLRVWLDDGAMLGLEDDTPVQLEAVLAGVLSKNEVEAAGQSVSRTPHSFWNWVSTDESGRFSLPGLLDREYRVKVMDTESLVLVESDPTNPTEGPMHLVFPSESGHRKVAGVVRLADGTPVAEVNVNVSRRSVYVEYGQGNAVSWDSSGERVRSAADGSFRLDRVPIEDVRLGVHGEGLVYRSIDLKNRVDIEDLEILVEREAATCHVQVELSGEASSADSFELLDSEGENATLAVVRGGSTVSTTHADIVDGRSLVLRVLAGEYELVLHKGGERVSSQWVSIVPGDVVTLRP